MNSQDNSNTPAFLEGASLDFLASLRRCLAIAREDGTWAPEHLDLLEGQISSASAEAEHRSLEAYLAGDDSQLPALLAIGWDEADLAEDRARYNAPFCNCDEPH